MHFYQILLVTTFAILTTAFRNYTGHQVFQINPENDKQALILTTFQEKDGFNFWSEIRRPGHTTTVMVAPEKLEGFKAILRRYRIPFDLIIEDAERLFEKERSQLRAARKLDQGEVSFDKFMRYEEIQAYLSQLAADHPDIATVDTIGDTYEGRQISIIRISSGGDGTKPIILIDGGIHAREWIAPAQVLYIIHQLVEEESNRGLIEAVDWHIIPVLNPDGYEYTHTDDRMWRKTRSKGTKYYGVDANRNFDFHWMETGASDNEGSEIYAGPFAFSEHETTDLKTYVEEYASEIKLYLTFHSFGQYMIFPWGYTSALPDNYRELYRLGSQAANAIEAVNGHEYTVGTSTNVLYAAAGGSDDWVKGVGGVALSYTIELPGGGTTGFDPEPEEIRGIVEETWEGILVFHDYVKNI